MYNKMDENVRKYLVSVGIDVMQIRIVDIPVVVLKLCQYAESLKDLDGESRKELVINTVKIIGKTLRPEDLLMVNSLVDSYIAIDKSVEIIHAQGCCVIS